jgi:ubiquinone/menaquinone biosynthesis C-methylase UbiE
VDERNSSFQHSTPELYDRYMGPLLFAPYASVIAEHAARFRPTRILETAAGTGILTSALSKAVPQARIVATDVNAVLVEFAAKRVRSERVSFERADALNLPYSEGAFDLVLCQFGVMFFPDKIRANQEARRVLSAGGHYLVVTFDRLELNPIPKAAGDAVAAMFSDDPPEYMNHGPFSYSAPALIEQDLLAAGFTNVALHTVAISTHVSARDAALGMVLGSPLRAEIERRNPSALERALDIVTQALRPWDGKQAPMSAHVAIATK